MTRFNRSEIMRNANNLRAEKHLGKSEALRRAWAMAKIHNIDRELDNLSYVDRWSIAQRDEVDRLRALRSDLRAIANPKPERMYVPEDRPINIVTYIPDLEEQKAAAADFLRRHGIKPAA